MFYFVKRLAKIGALTIVAALSASCLTQRYWRHPAAFIALPELWISYAQDGTAAVRASPGIRLTGELARFTDEPFAYLMFSYLRGRNPDADLVLTYSAGDGSITYVVRAILPDDFMGGLGELYQISSTLPFLDAKWNYVDRRLIRDWRVQTRAFDTAYNLPAYRKLEQLSQAEITAYAQRFIRFKSETDPRIRRQIGPVPRALTVEQAEGLAQDIVRVAEFYGLPLDFFLGIGAMENNFMNVQGDLGHAIWKRRPDPGDLVLQRKNGRVLVLNESSGVWQITRETIRYAHRLVRRDKRDYGELPEHLRPPEKLDVAAVDPLVLTTYAGVLFRDLLDRFEGNVELAVGAYNGGWGNPNLRYAEGAANAAAHARRALENAAALRGKRVVDMQFLSNGS